MKDFLTTIIKQIVENPDAVVVEETQDSGRVNLQIKVANEDMGRVIGKEGKVINSIRMIMRVMAIRKNVRIRVDIEDNRPQQPAPAAQPAVEQDASLDTAEPMTAEETQAEVDTTTATQVAEETVVTPEVAQPTPVETVAADETLTPPEPTTIPQTPAPTETTPSDLVGQPQTNSTTVLDNSKAK